MKASTYKTPQETVVRGFAALVEELGPGGALRFMHQFEIGRGDYTKERPRILKDVRLEDLKRKMLKF